MLDIIPMITPSHGRVRLVRPFWAITFALCLFPSFFTSLSLFLSVCTYLRLRFLFLFFLLIILYMYKHAIFYRVGLSFRRSSCREVKTRAGGNLPEKREEMTLSSVFSQSLVGTSLSDPRAV